MGSIQRVGICAPGFLDRNDMIRRDAGDIGSWQMVLSVIDLNERNGEKLDRVGVTTQ